MLAETWQLLFFFGHARIRHWCPSHTRKNVLPKGLWSTPKGIEAESHLINPKGLICVTVAMNMLWTYSVLMPNEPESNLDHPQPSWRHAKAIQSLSWICPKSSWKRPEASCAVLNHPEPPLRCLKASMKRLQFYDVVVRGAFRGDSGWFGVIQGGSGKLRAFSHQNKNLPPNEAYGPKCALKDALLAPNSTAYWRPPVVTYVTTGGPATAWGWLAYRAAACP